MRFRVRPASATDQDEIRRAIYQAWRWRDAWSEAAFQQHLSLGLPDSYVDEFGSRRGDAGYVGELDSAGVPQVVGAAWYRFFTDEDHRAGFVAPDVPEIVVAVWERARGHGLGRALTARLVAHAAHAGVPGLSLHVSSGNTRAQGLYRDLGFVVVTDSDSTGVVMIRRVTD